jgi:hypothetical protein
MLYAVTMGIGPTGKVCIAREKLSIVQKGGMWHIGPKESRRLRYLEELLQKVVCRIFELYFMRYYAVSLSNGPKESMMYV